MTKEKWVSQEEKEWITEEIQAIKKLIKECEERHKRKSEIQIIRALEKEKKLEN